MTPLAASLGRLGAPPRRTAWEPIRLAMVDRLVEAHAAGRLDGAAWLAAWHEAAAAMRDEVVRDAQARLERAAVHSRLPGERLRELLPDDRAADRLLQQLLAEGIALEQLEPEPESAATTRRRGAALEAAWEAATAVADQEAARHRLEAERVLAWRRPWRPLVIVATVAGLVALTVAAMIGGYLRAPGWFEPVVEAFWRLPWP